MADDREGSLRDGVRERYAGIARKAAQDVGGCCGEGTTLETRSCCGGGYDPSSRAEIPEGADLGLGCGRPVEFAGLRAGEDVLDLGAGAGVDVFLASARVGPSGSVVGVDMTPEMIERARENLVRHRQRTGLDNVEFRLGEIEELPLADAAVDVVLSNCVLNLSDDKPRVWNEIARVLRPGGRVAIADTALTGPIPERLREDRQAWAACVAGALPMAETRALMEAAGLEAIDMKVLGRADDAGTGVGVVSVEIHARRPSID